MGKSTRRKALNKRAASRSARGYTKAGKAIKATTSGTRPKMSQRAQQAAEKANLAEIAGRTGKKPRTRGRRYKPSTMGKKKGR